MNTSLKHLSKLLGLGLLCAMLLAILAVTISEVHSFDVFWQLQNGRYMVETMSLIHTDTFTLAAGRSPARTYLAAQPDPLRAL